MRIQTRILLLAGAALIEPAHARARTDMVQFEPNAQATSSATTQENSYSDTDIVVTARRTEERAQDIPLAITAIGGPELRTQGVTDLSNLNAIVPNLSVRSGNNNPGSVSFTIRGQTQSNVLLTVDSAVGVYQDDVSNPRSIGLLGAALLDIQRVEVLRGPQGTLYGRNTTGGAVSIYTQDPKVEVGATVEATLANYRTRGLSAILNLPVSESAGFRFVGSASSHDGYGQSLGPRKDVDDPRSGRNRYLRGKFVGTVGPLRISLSGDYYHDLQGGHIARINGLYDPTLFDANPNNNGTNLGGNAARAVALELGLNPNVAADLAQARSVLASYINKPFYEIYNEAPVDSKDEGGSAALRLDWELSDQITARSITGYRKFSHDRNVDLDGTPFDLFKGHYWTHDRFFSQELQLIGSVGPVRWLLGAYYSDEQGDENSANTNNVRVTPTLAARVGDVGSSSEAAFGQVNWEFLPGLTATGGIRYTRETKTLVNRNTNDGVCVVAPALLDTPGVCAATLKDSFSAPSWLLSVDYKLSNDILLYAKVARGFHGGGQQLRATGTNIANYDAYAPETVTEYELGLKSDLFDRRLRLNVAAFYDDFSDAQRSVTVLVNGVSTTLVTNAAKARLTGVEVESVLRVSDAFSIAGTGGYLGSKYTKFQDVSGDRTNEPFPAPKWTGTIGSRLHTPTNFGVLRGSLSYTWQSEQNIQPQARLRDQQTQPAYGLVNGSLAVSFDRAKASIEIFGKNLLDEEYNASFVTLESIGMNLRQAGEPRTWGVRLTKHFGGEGG